MYREIYRTENVQISLTQIVMAAAIVLLAYVLPVAMISQYQEAESPVYTAEALSERNNSGRVAGASTLPSSSQTGTANAVAISLAGNTIQIPSETGILLIAGCLLTASGCVSVAYLLVTREG